MFSYADMIILFIRKKILCLWFKKGSNHFSTIWYGHLEFKNVITKVLYKIKNGILSFF